MYKAADGPAWAALLAKLGVEKSYSSKLVDARSAVQLKTVNVIKEYRMMYSAHLHAHNKLISSSGPGPCPKRGEVGAPHGLDGAGPVRERHHVAAHRDWDSQELGRAVRPGQPDLRAADGPGGSS